MASRKDKKKAAAKPIAPPPALSLAVDRREIALAAGVALVGAALFVAPVFSGWDRWGINDWDQHQMFYGVPYWSIVQRGEWPFWNPFMCGGNAMLADPQSPFLNPLFAVVVALGVLPGLKILIWLHAALSLFGAWIFARRLGCGRIAAWVPAAAFGFSSAYALHVATGHSTWFAMAYLPLGLCALHAGFERPVWGVAGGAAVALTLFIGNAYLFAYLLLFAGLWALLVAAQRRSWKPVVAMILMTVTTVGFAAVKLLPITDFMGKVTTPEVPDRSSGDLQMLWAMLLGRAQDLTAHAIDIDPGATQLDAMVWRWWEYGAYIGPVVLLLALGYALRRFRTVWPLCALIVIAVLLSLGNRWGVWDVLRHLPVFEGLRVPSRGIVVAVLLLGVLAGLWVTEWELRFPKQGLLLAGAVTLVALDIGYVGRSAFHQAFGVEPLEPAPGPFRQGFGKKDFRNAYNHSTKRYDAAYSDMYPAFLANKGIVNCYDRLHLPIGVQPADLPTRAPNPAYRGEAWIVEGGRARIEGMGGRRIEIALEPAGAGTLIVNQNYDTGWRAQDGRPLVAREGVIAMEVAPADRAVVLVYTPPRFWAGLALSLLTLLASVAAVVLSRRRADEPAPVRAGEQAA